MRTGGVTGPKVKTAEWGVAELMETTALHLAEDDIHVWLAYVPAFQEKRGELQRRLSPEESARMERFYFPEDRERFAVARALLRSLCGRYENIPAEWIAHIRIVADRCGKPLLHSESKAGKLAFNLSHSRHLVAAVFSRERQVGIDVECVRDVPEWPELVQHFHPDEQDRLRAVPATEQQRAFFDCWTRKEAFVKATGEGLSRPLHSFCLTADEKEGLFRVQGDGPGWDEWRILSFAPAPGYAGAIAFEQGKQSGISLFPRR